jgi:hypothetical protein
MDLARQIGGEVSLRTVIAGERYYVVWRGDEPVDSFPMLPEKAGSLAGRPELAMRDKRHLKTGRALASDEA